ncbi:MAG: hypothetical protein JRG91_12840, partial [Deltaproteobacteria bacterium]|nr:hypothetical protein [Deltaproteobacteria bacterium]
ILTAAVLFLAGCDQDDYYYDAYPEYSYDTSHEGSDSVPDTPTEGTPDPTGSAVAGDPCYAATDCGGVPGSSRQCVEDISGYAEFPGGYCTALCTSAIDCGPDAVCADFMGYDFYCFKRCSSDEVCRTGEGYSCKTLDTGSSLLCLPPVSGSDS